MNTLYLLLRGLADAQQWKGTNAMVKTAETLNSHLDGAWKEYDQLENLKHDYDELERENAELRRRLRAAGLSDKIDEAVVAA